MAAFLVRTESPPLAPVDYFSDDDRSSFQSSINRLAAAGITGGCGSGIFCPNGTVTRGQMAAFLRRALTTAPAPEDCTLFPASNVWNRRVDGLDVAANSATLITTIGASEDLHPDFGSYLGYGIPLNVVDASRPRDAR